MLKITTDQNTDVKFNNNDRNNGVKFNNKICF